MDKICLQQYLLANERLEKILPLVNDSTPENDALSIELVKVSDVIEAYEKENYKIDTPMPTVFIFMGFRFMFYSNDHEPIHVHVIKDNNEAKYNVAPIEQVYNHGFKKHEISMIESIIEENKEVIEDRWHSYFNK